MSEIKVNSVVNSTGDNDSGLDLSTNDQVIIKTANTTAVTINSSQNVGIGETAPLGKLHIRSSDASITSVNANSDELVLENNGTCGISIGSGTSSTGNISFIDSGDTNQGRIQYDHSDDHMNFRVNDAERMRIDSSGNLLHSTTSTLNMGASNAEGFSLLSGGVLRISCDGNNALHVGRINSEGRAVRFACTGTSNVGNINVTNSSTAYATSSDYRLKENITYDFEATSRLKKLKPCRFNFIADADNTVDGFLAHEVSSIVPEAIFGEKDAVDEDGNIDPQNIDQQKLVPLLTKTLQEALTRIDTLEAEVKALKG